TDAIVLHASDYMETSRIVRLITRDAGVQSVLARGARRGKTHVGVALDLFAEGEAQIYMKPGRDLQTLGAFDITNAHTSLAHNFDRFLGAAVLAELILRIARDDASPEMYSVVATSLDALATSSEPEVTSTTLRGAWRIVSASGLTPSLDQCAACHAA